MRFLVRVVDESLPPLTLVREAFTVLSKATVTSGNHDLTRTLENPAFGKRYSDAALRDGAVGADRDVLDATEKRVGFGRQQSREHGQGQCGQ